MRAEFESTSLDVTQAVAGLIVRPCHAHLQYQGVVVMPDHMRYYSLWRELFTRC